MFIYQNDGDSDLTFKDVSANYYKPDNHTSKFDFSLEITPNADYFDLRLEYCKSLYDMNFIQITFDINTCLGVLILDIICFVITAFIVYLLRLIPVFKKFL